MRFTPSIFTSLLKPIDRRGFKEIVKRHDGDAYGKTFNSWEHLVTLLFAQFTGADSLRAIETSFNAQSNHHYHLGCGRVARSTLADANARRPAAIFGQLFTALSSGLGRNARKEGKAILQLIDSTPVPLSRLFDCAASNGRIHGLKLHVLHDLASACPLALEITPANVNDIAFSRPLPIKAGVIYVFDKAYCHFGWWTAIDQAGAFFITRPKINMSWKTMRLRPLADTRGDGFTVKADREVTLASKGDSKLPIFLRRITIKPDTGKAFDILTNDQTRSATELAASYKARWQIELLFRWIKQNLNIGKFIAFNENAVRLQILAAMIALVLIAIARKLNHPSLSPRRFAELISAFIHARRRLASIDRPPPINPSGKRQSSSSAQIEIQYA
jgi:putative transposase